MWSTTLHYFNSAPNSICLNSNRDVVFEEYLILNIFVFPLVMFLSILVLWIRGTCLEPIPPVLAFIVENRQNHPNPTRQDIKLKQAKAASRRPTVARTPEYLTLIGSLKRR